MKRVFITGFESSYSKIINLYAHRETKTKGGLGLILSGFFNRACVIYIYVVLRYHPNQINIRILCKLFNIMAFANESVNL